MDASTLTVLVVPCRIVPCRVVSLSLFVGFGNTHVRWRVAKRPGLDAFLKEMAQLYEVVVFTDSMGGLADEVRGR